MSTIKKLYLPLFALLLTTTALHALPGDITTIAGGFNTDGLPATEAHFKTPYHIAVNWRGDVYISDLVENRVRKINGETGIITTVAGNGAYDFAGDNGPAIEASLASPRGIWVKGDDLYIADSANSRIRKVTPDGIITTVAGIGAYGYDGDGGVATRAMLAFPEGVYVDTDNYIYIADTDNNVVRLVDPNGIITTIAGNGTLGDSTDDVSPLETSFKHPKDVYKDGTGHLYIVDSSNQRIRKIDAFSNTITTIAGNGSFRASGDGGPATEAGFWSPRSICMDIFRNLYIADSSSGQIRIVAVDGIINTFAGNGQTGFSGDGGLATDASLNRPTDIASDPSGNLYIADESNGRIRKVTPDGIITTIAGGNIGDGQLATQANLYNPADVHITTQGELYIADNKHSRIRKIDANGIITTIAGTGQPGSSSNGQQALESSFPYPRGITIDDTHTLYLSTLASKIHTVDPHGITGTVAGNGRADYSGDGGQATNASLNKPNGIFIIPNGTLFVAEEKNHCIRMISPNGEITTVVGNGTAGYTGDGGSAADASLNHPRDVFIGTERNLYIADESNHCVRMVDRNGIITTVAGNGQFGASGDGGPATEATLSYPRSVYADAEGKIFIADRNNHAIRMVDTHGIITTIAGNGRAGYSGDGGPATDASLNIPEGLWADGAGNLYIADADNHRIRMIEGVATPYEREPATAANDPTDQNEPGESPPTNTDPNNPTDGAPHSEDPQNNPPQDRASGNDEQTDPTQTTNNDQNGNAQSPFALSADLDFTEGNQAMHSRTDMQPESVVYIQIFGHNISNAVGFAARFEYDPSKLNFAGFDPDGVLVGGISPGVESGEGYVEITAATLGNTITEERGLMGLARFVATPNFDATTIQITNAQLRRNAQFETYDAPTVLELSMAPCPDINGDGRVGFADFLPFAEAFGSSRGTDRYHARYDLDADATIGFGDFLILSQFYGTEVDCAHAPSASKTVAIAGTNTEAQIQLISTPGSQNNQIRVGIQVQNARQIKGYHLDLSYNPEMLELIHIQGRNGSAFGAPIIHTAPGSAI